MNSSKVWYFAHLGFAIALALLSAVSVALLAANSSLPLVNSFPGVIIFVFVVPGALLVFTINHLILWRRKPRVIRTADKVVMIIVAVLIVAAIATTVDDEFAFGALFFVVPLLMIAGVVSTIVIAVGNVRSASPAAPAAPIVPGAAPAAATLDQLFPEQTASDAVAGTPPAPLAEPGEPPATDATPYGPKS